MQVGSTVKLALEIERIVAGEPLAMIGLRVDSMSPEQLQSQLQDLMDRLQRTGSLMTKRDEHEIEWEELEHGGAYAPPKVTH
jgi:predicted ATPase